MNSELRSKRTPEPGRQWPAVLRTDAIAAVEDELEDERLTAAGDLDMDDEAVPEFTFADVLVRVCAVTKKQRPPRDFVIVSDHPVYLPYEPGEEQLTVYINPPEPTPTKTRPGTAERIAVYEERYRRRQALHTRADAGESLRHAREIKVAPNGRPLVVGEVEQTWDGNRRIAG